VDLRAVVWIKEFLLGCSQRVRVDGHLSDDVRVTSGVPQESVLGPPLFLAYVNDIWRGIYSDIRLFADDPIIYRKILDSNDTNDIGKLQRDLNRLGQWAVENDMKINLVKSKAVGFMKVRVKERLRYYFGYQLIPEATSFKYVGINIRSDVSWADPVNYKLRKAWKALHLIMCIHKQVNNTTKRLAYTSLVRPILEYWDP
jgi:hypothetical protein